MKLVVLIVIGVVVLAAAVASYYHYSRWDESRYDQLIDEAARRHALDPALVKALIVVQSRLAPGANEGRFGLMLVTEGKIEDYRLAVLGRPWGYICVHRHFRNHSTAKPEQFTSMTRGDLCRVSGCGQRLIEEPSDPEISVDIGCWTLQRMRTFVLSEDPGLSPNDLERRMLVAYRYGLPRGTFTMTAEQERFVNEVIHLQVKYTPAFERLAGRRAAH